MLPLIRARPNRLVGLTDWLDWRWRTCVRNKKINNIRVLRCCKLHMLLKVCIGIGYAMNRCQCTVMCRDRVGHWGCNTTIYGERYTYEYIGAANWHFSIFDINDTYHIKYIQNIHRGLFVTWQCACQAMTGWNCLLENWSGLASLMGSVYSPSLDHIIWYYCQRDMWVGMGK